MNSVNEEGTTDKMAKDATNKQAANVAVRPTRLTL